MNLENSDKEDNSSTVNGKLTPLTKRESIGWYFLSAANGVYGGAPIGVLIPLLLENLSGQAGYELDLVTPCNTAKLYLLAGVFAIISNCCYGASNIFTIAYIPIFARNHPKVIDAKNSDVPISEIKKLEDKMTVKFSSKSLIVAIFAIMIVMFATGGILVLLKDSPYAIQIALVFAGSCWLILLIFPAMWLTKRPKPPLPSGENYLLYSWKRVGKTLLSTRSLWQTMKCLFGWFFISDGVNTLIVVGVLLGRKQLGLTDAEIALMSALVPLFEIIGISIFLYLQKLFHLTEKKIVVISCIFAIFGTIDVEKAKQDADAFS
ncbi:33968_t:CDS:2, partial [Racocetra persica]